jgi:hypothetical protein
MKFLHGVYKRHMKLSFVEKKVRKLLKMSEKRMSHDQVRQYVRKVYQLKCKVSNPQLQTYVTMYDSIYDT